MKKIQENKEICSFHAFLQMKETAGRVRLRLENSICDSLSIKVSLCLLCLEKRQNPSHIFKPRKDIQKNISIYNPKLCIPNTIKPQSNFVTFCFWSVRAVLKTSAIWKFKVPYSY